MRLSDFGLAKAVNALTLLASARGTLGFKPPESLDNLDSPAADIWALGTLLYLLLTDVMPFSVLSGRDVADARRFLRPVRPPSLYNVSVDAGLESIVYRCLAASAADRYVDATELLHDMEQWTPECAAPGDSFSVSSQAAKNAIGPGSPHDLKAEARRALDEAMRAADGPAGLAAAADLLAAVS